MKNSEHLSLTLPKRRKKVILKRYFYKLLSHYLSVYIRPNNSFLEVDPLTDMLRHSFKNFKVLFLNQPLKSNFIDSSIVISSIDELGESKPDYIILTSNIHYERDIQGLLDKIHRACTPSTRIIVTYYSTLWKPVIKLATAMGLRIKTPEQNWLTHEDVLNILELSNFEPIFVNSKIIFPLYIPLISDFINRYLAPLPFFRIFGMMNILMARPIFHDYQKDLSVSIVVPAKNESENIENIVKRVPKMSPNDELIFIEGNSADDTWAKIQEIQRKYRKTHNIKIARQDGKGKVDAVRKGFQIASGDILMILDADLTVPPESLPLFYNAIKENKGEFINGSRFVYPMEEKAMRFFNILGNKFFALAFSFVLGQKLKDTLCGTKVISKENYLKIAENRSYFSEFDPFGDFDLIFGASRLGLKIIEIPINYKERTYGETNINRWRDGAILFRMLFFAARKIKFI